MPVFPNPMVESTVITVAPIPIVPIACVLPGITKLPSIKSLSSKPIKTDMR